MTVRRFWYDTEFWERGNGHPIIPISIGVVGEEGDSKYLINGHAPLEEIWANPWMRDNILRQLPITVYADERDENGIPRLGWDEDSYVYNECVFTPAQIAVHLEEFLTVGQYWWDGQDELELWADWSAYDHVVLSQLWGTMIQLPQGMPMRTNCTQQLIDDAGLRERWMVERPVLEAEAGPAIVGKAHNALADAAWCKEVWTWATHAKTG